MTKKKLNWINYNFFIFFYISKMFNSLWKEQKNIDVGGQHFFSALMHDWNPDGGGSCFWESGSERQIDR